MLGNLLKDFRFAGRMLTKSPVVTGAAMLSLALGIGANTKTALDWALREEHDAVVEVLRRHDGHPRIPMREEAP